MFTKTATMCDVGDVFAADIQYYDHCCKIYMNKYHPKFEEIMRNLEMGDSIAATNDSLKENFWLLLDFSKSTHSLKFREAISERPIQSRTTV